ncbi:hypothetical protein Tco_1098376, partial [Tanacetum coccineum]
MSSCMETPLGVKPASWWDVKSPHASSFEEWEMWTSSLTLSSRRKQILE